MNLILDFGNTCQKMAIVAEDGIRFQITQPRILQEDIIFADKMYPIGHAILSSVVNDTEEIEHFLQNKYRFIKLSPTTRIQVKNKYKTKSTLGSDRLACAVAAHNLFPDRNVLILQAGSCLTSDFISAKGEYLGGSISPGMDMRFQALHCFSARLPLTAYKNINFITGRTTEEAVLSGVINGITAECNYIIKQYKIKYPSPRLKVILTGGNVKEFEKTINHQIVTFPNLVIIGLDLILRYNVEK
ncbi:MAG: type III pantothenate kinase [Bacteroidales bacterium]|jgi:type III pantothenate kinase|nr:type III pantothenate kinase [Bacteroidales bacterium]